MESKLKEIHDLNFSVASKNIKIYQNRYENQYNQRKKVIYESFKVGDKVKFLNLKNLQRKGGKHEVKYFPLFGYYIIKKIFLSYKTCLLKNPKTYKTLKQSYHFNVLVKYDT